MTPKNAQNGGGDRNALKVPVMEDGLRGWSYDIFDCFADRRTCMSGLRSTTLLSAVSQLTGDVFQAAYLVAVAAMFIRGTSCDTSTLRDTAPPFGNQSKGSIVTVSCFACTDKGPRRCRFVCHSPSPWIVGHRLLCFHRPSPGMMCAGDTGSVVMPTMTLL